MVKNPTRFSVAICSFLLSVALYTPQALADHIAFSIAPIDDLRGVEISLEKLAEGLTSPLKGVAAPGQPDRLYVVDQIGILWAVDLTTPPPSNKTVFLDVRDRLVTLGVLGPNTFDERGLLGVAFHPNYQTNGKLYTYTSEPTKGQPDFPSTVPRGKKPDHQNVVAEWRVPSPASATSVVDPKSRRELMRVDWPQFNHDAGDLAFGPDGHLYISMGDGGGADDFDGQLFIVATGSFPVVQEPIVGHQGNGNAQKLNTPLGKILRIDVDRNGDNPPSANGQYEIPADNPFVSTPGAVKEIFAFGLRNPYRFSFDTATGALVEADVGQNDIEEVNLIVAGGNYGWNLKEGTFCFDPNGNDPGFADPSVTTLVCPFALPPVIDPIAQYDHLEGHSVIGGFVYRGTRISQLDGRYVFGEFSRLFEEFFPSGPFNFGRLLYLQRKSPGSRLLEIKEFKGFEEAIAALGLRVEPPSPVSVPVTLAVLGMGQDASGEVYVMGNINGLPFGTEGVVLRIAPK